MGDSSRIPGFYKKSIDDRRALISARAGVELRRISESLATGGMSPETADKIVENVVGIYALPFGIALNVTVNKRDVIVPMVVEEPSVIAAASNASKMIRAGGGFEAEVVNPLMISQVQLYDVGDPIEATARLEKAAEELLQMATESVPNLVARGGGPRAIEVRDIGEGSLVLHVLVDCRDAMGANLVNTIAEAIGDRAAEVANGKLGLRILSNLCDRRVVDVKCRVLSEDLVKRTDSMRPLAPGQTTPPEVDGRQVVDAIVQASRFAELDPYRAATHNKGIMNGVDAVVIATGNDFRAVEAGAHAYAARTGRYSPLAIWRRDGDDLTGEMKIPLALGTVGGTLRVHPAARLALDILGIESASDLAMVAASVGMASNLAALRALATEGIQRGHMSLHARSVATAAGAEGTEVERVASAMAERGTITVELARSELDRLRKGNAG